MRKYINFAIKVISCIIILSALFYYQSVAVERARLVAENEAAISEVEAYNAKILAAMEESKYKDGEYTGEGVGFGGPVTVKITITDGRIADMQVTEHSGEDPAYFSQAQALTDTVIKYQTWEVDTVSGATYSSRGILDAAADALGKAVK